MIEIGALGLKSVSLARKDDGTIVISGTFEMISSKGKVIAKQDFNTYNGIEINFDKTLTKNMFSDVESFIEIELGVQEAVKNMKGEK